MAPSRTRAVVWLIVACALWGLSFPVVKALHLEQTARLPHVSTTFLAAWMQVARFGLAALLLLPLMWRFKPTRNELRQGGLLALWGGLGMGIQADGLAYTAASTSAFLTQAYCVILPLWAALRHRVTPSRRVIGATFLVFLGGAILSGIRPGELTIGRGELETLLASVIFTFQILTLENPKYEGNRSLPVTFLMSLGIALIFLPPSWLLASAPSDLISAGASTMSWFLISLLALFCSVGAYLLMNRYQPRVSATEAGLIYTIEPVFAAAYSLFLPAWLSALSGQAYLNENITSSMISGGSMILAANLLLHWKTAGQAPHCVPGVLLIDDDDATEPLIQSRPEAASAALEPPSPSNPPSTD